jgi:hypothetical protein
MSQTSYDLNMAAGQAGQKVNAMYDYVESKAAEGAIPFGRAVVAGTDAEKQVAVASADTETFRGVALFTHSIPQDMDQSATMGEELTDGAEYRDKDTVSVLRKGQVWVEVTADVTADEDAYVDVLTDGEEGKFTNVDTDNLSANGVFRTSADEGELAVLEINLP